MKRSGGSRNQNLWAKAHKFGQESAENKQRGLGFLCALLFDIPNLLRDDNFHARSKTKFAKKLFTIFPGEAERTNIRHAKPGNHVG